MRAQAASFDINEGLGDLDGDGDVDVADWNLFRPNILAPLAGLTPEQAFALGDFKPQRADRRRRLRHLQESLRTTERRRQLRPHQ